MSTTNNSFTQELSHCNARLDARLRDIGMTVKTYKAIKATTQLVGVLASSYAMAHPGVEPALPLVIIGGIILGPEYIEAKIGGDVGIQDGDRS